MTARKRSIKSDLAKVDAHRITKAEYDEAPVLTQLSQLEGKGEQNQ
jgi:hypothetical protein